MSPRRGAFRRLIQAVFVIGLLGPNAAPSDDQFEKEVEASYDCGILALYNLLRLEGRSMTLPEIENCLPAPTPGGYSMKQLREAASACGLGLLGVRLDKGNRAPDRPMLAFLKRGPHGHFLVVRPVGHTATLVQVIDSTHEPEVLDAADLYASPEWTGLALIPHRPNWPARIVAALGGGTAVTVAAIYALPRLRRRRKAASSATGLSAPMTDDPAAIVPA